MALDMVISNLVATVYWQGDPPPFDHEAMVSTEPNRWNGPGEPTVYLAGDIGLALVEGGRHLRDAPDAGSERVIWTTEVRSPGIIDVRTSAGTEVDHPDSTWVLDRGRCRRLSATFRGMDGVAGIVVPSAGSLDDLSRWNLVLFVDRLSAPLEEIIRRPQIAGRLELGAS